MFFSVPGKLNKNDPPKPNSRMAPRTNNPIPVFVIMFSFCQTVFYFNI
ncbi:hypothetical protein P700755_001204 [Psychroflexus torquis ATCC 700755]|uniref:Uncharacterized protein n=1 Tax=Psychroflexus torquis (strain ATCC 700755 / CIP 106069 / ACAM 623) TaxID=313595 RepID=K4IC15_PSYTT|nr:hypothetical protein P700755_001204 [Psychroflexus torquis ATCC 700755]